jgi:CBS domain-containing protein
MMRVEQLMARPVQCCRPEDSLARAAQLMWDHDCGCLPVCGGDGITRVVGIITDRDICMRALFQGKPLQELRVSEAMAKQVHVCRPSESLADAEKTMREARIRRLPVVDEQNALVGMISLADLAQEAARERSATSQEITETEVGDTLAAICVPPHREVAAA